MALYVDEYGIVSTEAIIFATTVDPCYDAPTDDQIYLIILMLQAGDLGQKCRIEYPQRGLRDAAFEEIVRLVKQEWTELEEEEGP